MSKVYAEVQKNTLGTIRVLKDGIKLYTSERRAKLYGNCREPSPVGDKWVALPFWHRNGGINSYYTENEYAQTFHGISVG